jgi:ribosome biogenesis GTPase A
MFKTKKEIISDLKLIDVVVELLDARIPVSSRNPDIQELTKNKKKIILLNKSDLASEEDNQKWLSFFTKQAPTILTDASTGRGINSLNKAIEKIMEEEKAIQASRGRINKTTRVMILGIPNVGKSSLINRLNKKIVAQVGNKPGVTRQKQWIRIGNNQELLDTPGVLWPKFESEKVALNLAFTGTIKDDIIEKVDIAYELLKVLYKDYLNNLIERYKLSKEELDKIKESKNYAYTLMQIIALKRGCLLSGGRVDDEKVASLILDDFRSGKLGRITLEKC